jgi:hypothetical protein
MISHFSFFSLPDPARRISEAGLARVDELVKQIPLLRRGLIFTPIDGDVAHPFPDDEKAPALALQLSFPTIEALEAAAATDGALQALAKPDLLPELADARIVHQAMLTRAFPVDEPAAATVDRQCSYLVHYPGGASDLNAWLRHYLTHHPQIMRKFPGIREIEIFTRLEWFDSLPWTRVDHFQRNKLVFDDPQSLSAALLSPVIREMRADYHRFPPFTGLNVHYVLATRRAVPSADHS